MKWCWMSAPPASQAFKNRLVTTKTLVWNGPFGAFETRALRRGNRGGGPGRGRGDQGRNLLSVAGGGDTVAALAHAGVDDDFSYVSTAGGAFLEWLEGKDLAGRGSAEGAKARG